MLSDIILEFE